VQIIVGPGRSFKVRDQIESISGDLSSEEDGAKDEESKEKKGFLKTLSSIFVPAIPAIIASGLIMGLNSIIVNLAEQEVLNAGIDAVGDLSAQQVVLESWNLLKVSTFLEILGS